MDYKICPTCSSKNHVSDMLCNLCMADISAILPQEVSVTEKKVNTDTKHLFLLFQNGIQKQIKNGDIIGRNLLGAEVLQEYKTISRKHARFTFENEKWFVEDLSSSNGIYIDDVKIPAEIKVEIKNQQKLCLSKSFITNIEIK